MILKLTAAEMRSFYLPFNLLCSSESDSSFVDVLVFFLSSSFFVDLLLLLLLEGFNESSCVSDNDQSRPLG